MTLIVLTCTKTKATAPGPRLTAESLPPGPLERVAAEWRRRLELSTPDLPARALYSSRAFDFGLRAALEASATPDQADSTGAPVAVISAGLGFVPGHMWVPSYELTVAGSSSIESRITERFDPRAWWREVCRGTFSLDPVVMLDKSSGPILMALSSSYATLIHETLEAIAPATVERLRIFGRNIERYLPPRVRPCIRQPDDADLVRAGLNGVLADYHQRALLGYVRGRARHG